MSFRKPCHMPFRKLIPPFTLTVKVKHFSEETKKRILNTQQPGPASLQVTKNWHLSFIDNYLTSDNASSFNPTLIKMAHTHIKLKAGE